MTLHSVAARRCVGLIALMAVAAGAIAQPGEDPMKAALNRLAEAGPFRVEFEGVFERDGQALTDIRAQGGFAGPFAYELSATLRLMDESTSRRVVRIGDRQWEWSSDSNGWRATLAGEDMLSQSIAGLLASLAHARDVQADALGSVGDVTCTPYSFLLPPGVASIEGLPVEGTGTLWVADESGLPLKLELAVRTAVGATGTATVLLLDHGQPVELHPPGLGSPPPEAGATLTGAALAEALESRPVVHWTLVASGDGDAVVESILPAGGEATVLDVYVLAERPAALARIRSGELVLGEMVVDGDVMCDYFLSPGEADAEPEWSCRRVDDADEQAPWRLHTQILEQALGERALEPIGPVTEPDGSVLLSYALDIDDGADAPGLFVPLVRDELVTGDAVITARVLVSEMAGELRAIELSVSGTTQAGQVLNAHEHYRFTYVLTDEEVAELDEAFSVARSRAVREDEVRMARSREIALLTERVARECAWAIGAPATMEVKLGRVSRSPGVLAAWVLGSDGEVLASAGTDADHPPALDALPGFSEGGSSNARELGDGPARLTVAPVLGREGEFLGYLVARWSAE